MLFTPEFKDKVEIPKDLGPAAGLAGASGRNFLLRTSPRHESALKRSPIF